MIHAASRQALAALRERLDLVLRSIPADDPAGYRSLAAELYSVADLLGRQPGLRRTLADPSTDASRRGDLIRSMLANKVSERAAQLVGAAVEQRWSSPWDLADSLDIIGDETLLAAAEQQNQLDSVEDELFRFERILDGAPNLVATLDDASASRERRAALVRSILEGKASATTVELVAHAVASDRKRTVQLAIDDLLEASAGRRQRSVARVISATELTDEQVARLSTALTRIYGRPINVRTAVDPDVRGGLMVRVGDEVIDGTVAARLAAARAALAR